MKKIKLVATRSHILFRFVTNRVNCKSTKKSLFQAFLGFDDKSAQKSESIAKARNRPVLGVHVVYARCLITTGAVQRRNARCPASRARAAGNVVGGRYLCGYSQYSVSHYCGGVRRTKPCQGCYSNNHHHNSNRIWARTFLDASHHTHTSNHTHASSGWRLVSACVRSACVSFACCCCAPLAPIVTTDFQLHAHQDSLALSFNGLF